MSAAKFHHPDDIRDSIESLQRAHGTGRPVIYWLALATTAAAVACIPLVRVDLSVGAPGQVRPAIERVAVQSGVAGRVRELSVADNQPVRKGDVLLVIDTAALDARLQENSKQQEENDHALDDLDRLLASPALSSALPGPARFAALDDGEFNRELPRRLGTPQYLRQHALLVSEVQRLLLQRAKALDDLARNQGLHAKGLITDSALAEQRYATGALERELDYSLQQTLSRWQTDRIERGLRKVTLASEARQLTEQRELFVVRAPTDGTAIGFMGLHAGMFLPADQRVGEISPGGSLQADVYIGSRDIGFVQKGQAVSLQVDAFPYTEWGTIKGRVRDISQDFIQVGQQPAFRAVIDLDQTRLTSAAGQTVDLRRGMTVNARFLLKERTLFNVLYGNLSDSFDPRAKRDAN